MASSYSLPAKILFKLNVLLVAQNRNDFQLLEGHSVAHGQVQWDIYS